MNAEQMKFSDVYMMLIKKAERKGRNKLEVMQLTSWLTGWSIKEIEEAMKSDMTYGSFFINAPKMNPDASKIKGKICGIEVSEIQDPLMQKIRWLDKLVDDLAKGKPIEKILPQ